MFNDTKLIQIEEWTNSAEVKRSYRGDPFHITPIWITIATILRNSPYLQYPPKTSTTNSWLKPATVEDVHHACHALMVSGRHCWWAAPERKNVKCSESAMNQGFETIKSQGSTGQPLWAFESDLKHFESFKMIFDVCRSPFFFVSQVSSSCPKLPKLRHRPHPSPSPEAGWLLGFSLVLYASELSPFGFATDGSREACICLHWEKSNREKQLNYFLKWSHHIPPYILTFLTFHHIPPYPDILSDYLTCIGILSDYIWLSDIYSDILPSRVSLSDILFGILSGISFGSGAPERYCRVWLAAGFARLSEMSCYCKI